MILVLSFFVNFSLGGVPDSFLAFTKVSVAQLLTTVLVPALFMAVMLSKSPRKSLRLNTCSVPIACAAVVMAICFHPLFMVFREFVMVVYPMTGDMTGFESAFENILAGAPGIWAILLVMAILPAVIEELAFRGFILSGLESLKNKWQAIAIASLFFGLSHSIIQQSIITGVVGIILGIIAVQTRSILPCILYHATHNSLTVLLSQAQSHHVDGSPVLSKLLQSPENVGYEYNIAATVVMGVLACGLLAWFIKLPTIKQEKDSSGHHGSQDLDTLGRHPAKA